MNSSVFSWTQRLQRYGHTGWADPIVYAYDQQERLATIKSVMSDHNQRGRVLDFGCGTGDFSKLLVEMDFEVCGYDPFVKPRINSNKFTYADTYDQIPFKNHSVDIVIAVTVLDHILDKNDIHCALATIRTCLKNEGIAYLLEYALDAENDRDELGLKNCYQAFRTLSEWKYLLQENSFRVEAVTPINHPLINPSEGYKAYSHSLLVQMSRKLLKLPVSKYWIPPLLRWQARSYAKKILVDRFIKSNNSSPLKLIRCSAV